MGIFKIFIDFRDCLKLHVLTAKRIISDFRSREVDERYLKQTAQLSSSLTFTSWACKPSRLLSRLTRVNWARTGGHHENQHSENIINCNSYDLPRRWRFPGRWLERRLWPTWERLWPLQQDRIPPLPSLCPTPTGLRWASLPPGCSRAALLSGTGLLCCASAPVRILFRDVGHGAWGSF